MSIALVKKFNPSHSPTNYQKGAIRYRKGLSFKNKTQSVLEWYLPPSALPLLWFHKSNFKASFTQSYLRLIRTFSIEKALKGAIRFVPLISLKCYLYQVTKSAKCSKKGQWHMGGFLLSDYILQINLFTVYVCVCFFFCCCFFFLYNFSVKQPVLDLEAYRVSGNTHPPPTQPPPTSTLSALIF